MGSNQRGSRTGCVDGDDDPRPGAAPPDASAARRALAVAQDQPGGGRRGFEAEFDRDAQRHSQILEVSECLAKRVVRWLISAA